VNRMQAKEKEDGDRRCQWQRKIKDFTLCKWELGNHVGRRVQKKLP